MRTALKSFDIEAVKKAAEIVLWFLSGLVSLWMMWVNLLSLGLFSGLIGAGLTIAFRDLLSNMFAGLFLHWDKSIRIGDVIRTSKGITGRVEDIRVQTHYSHQMTAAARAIAAMKFLMLRSKRVAIRRQSLRRQNMRLDNVALPVDGLVIMVLDLAVLARWDDGPWFRVLPASRAGLCCHSPCRRRVRRRVAWLRYSA